MATLLKIQKKIELALVYLAGVLLVCLMLIVTVESLLRKFASYSIPGIFEIASQLMVGVTVLGIAYVQSEKEHIQLDIMNKIMSPILIKITDFISYIIGVAVSGIFAYQGFFKFIESFQHGETAMGIVSIPFWPGRLAVFLAMALLCIRFIVDIILLFRKSEEIHVEERKEVIKTEANEVSHL